MEPVVKTSSLWLRPSVLAVCLAVSSPLLIQTALAQSSKSVAQAFDIPAGPLDATLTRIARQSGQIISLQPEQMQGRSAPAVRGEMSAEQAYRQALQGSGLELFVTGSGALNLRPVPTGTVSTLPEVKVKGSAQEDASGSAHGYVAKRSATGTKMDSSIIETPQSISVVTAQEMEVTKPQSLTDALAYTAGVFRSEGNDRTADRLYIRGFGADAIEGSLYRDGMKYMVNAFNGKQEVYGLERIEVLKGAASVLYGSAAPGGIINTVTKRPTTETLREVNMEVGSYNRKQISADLGGALTDDGVWSYRLTALKRDSDTFVDFVPDDRIYVAPALKWQPSAATSLTLLSHYQKSKTKYVFGFPAEGTILPNPNGRIPVNRYLGEPDRDRAVSTIESIGYIFEHAFSDTLRLRNNVSFFKASTSMPATWPNDGVFEDASMRTVGRYAESRREDKSSSIAIDVSLEYKWKLGEAANTLLAGIDHTKQEHQSERWLQSPSSLDLYNPVYGIPYNGAATFRNFPASRKERAWLTGAYLQNQTKIDDKWVVLLGGRQDKAKNGRSPLFGPEEWKDEKSSAFSGRAGLVYLADNGLAPFVSWSESFQPQSGSDRAGNRFDPTTGRQYEVGVRYQPKGSNTLLSAVVYQLTRQNVTTTDPTDNAYQVQTGEVRSRGLELEAKVQVTRSFGLVAAYAYTDARTIRSNDAGDVGKRTGAVPYNQFSAWGDYNFHALGMPGLKAGAGVRYVGSTVGTYLDVKVPAFTLLDAMVAYEVGHWRYAFNITNLTDKVHVTNCIDVCYYGEPRRAVATASYRW
ncbi:MAG: TonB-dependent siderophore receptor [Pseudomonadota bacterium]